MNIRKTHPALDGLTMETFRRNYAAIMERAGASLDSIAAHQGRNQSSVITRHYLSEFRGHDPNLLFNSGSCPQ